ncbi:hypothetical protein [Streptomyces sp. TE33382]
MAVQQLPPVSTLSEQQQRGRACTWCAEPLGTDLGEQRVRPATGAAYSWFPRECLDALACPGRRAAR